MCAWNFGTSVTNQNGVVWNTGLPVNGVFNFFYLQQIW